MIKRRARMQSSLKRKTSLRRMLRVWRRGSLSSCLNRRSLLLGSPVAGPARSAHPPTALAAAACLAIPIRTAACKCVSVRVCVCQRMCLCICVGLHTRELACAARFPAPPMSHSLLPQESPMTQHAAPFPMPSCLCLALTGLPLGFQEAGFFCSGSSAGTHLLQTVNILLRLCCSRLCSLGLRFCLQASAVALARYAHPPASLAAAACLATPIRTAACKCVSVRVYVCERMCLCICVGLHTH